MLGNCGGKKWGLDALEQDYRKLRTTMLIVGIKPGSSGEELLLIIKTPL